MLTSGFKYTPVSRLLLIFVVVSAIIASITDTKYYFYIQVVPHIWAWHQFWRILTWQLCYTNSTEVLFAALTFYNLRIVERLWGSRKFASFILVILPYTIFLPPLLLALVLRPLSFGNINYLPAGPTSILFAILAQYHAAIPSTYRYSVGMVKCTPAFSTATSSPTTTQSAAAQFTAMRNSTVGLTSKTIYYVLAVQLALSQFPSSILPAVVGWTVGYAYRNEVLPATSWRVPSWVVGQKNKKANVEALRRRLEGEDTADNEQNGVVGTGLAQISEIFNRRTQ
ncbi:uba domain-containing protein ucp14 [Venturia nashicola]|uniref:Uba domain-containing protein ucp14 n=1 Tax=Venturia nashicola TaxID=86259 RepID=A0A4Z1NK89_9PEZI|nr:uba domain-containing protein ucp14 [Venturia nashicola]TLD21646.1 uba domain-containing protein ucp14 [Venturia nashicola]